MKYQLFIDTVSQPGVRVAIKQADKLITERYWSGDRQQAEQLLPGISELLTEQQLEWSDLSAIQVANQGGSFTSLRIGVVTANALAYALGLPVTGTDGQPLQSDGYQIVEPEYSGQPNITIKKSSK
jgi:tRNA threonylcarbamoyl adenosine modification protein YeaZ